MILSGARVALGPERAERLDVEIRAGRIAALRRPSRTYREAIDLRGYLILPGLINAHDHLEFALFPRLGRRGGYRNAGDWARDIYRPGESPVREQLRVPKTARLLWGGLRNLLSGATTVCHHNPRAAVFERRFPVSVVERFGWAHSLEFSPDVAERFRRTPEGWPFILHLGEAVDGDARCDIWRLDEMGALDARTVLVHGVALDPRGLRLAKQRRASIVWCPSSNLFLLGRTLGPSAVRCGVRVALGTDSPLTAAGDLLDELRLARRVSGLAAAELYEMVTERAARVLRLKNGAGTVAEHVAADLAVFRDGGRSPAATLLDAANRGPELVMVGGKVKLASPALAKRLHDTHTRRLQPLAIEGRNKVLVEADVPRLYRLATQALGEEVFLGGKRVRA